MRCSPLCKRPNFSGVFNKIISRNPFCQRKPKRKPYRWLLQSNPMAHRLSCLVLLYPYPDTVRSGRLHKTLLSTLLVRRGLPLTKSGGAVDPAIADCRFRAPLTLRPARCKYYIKSKYKLQVNFAHIANNLTFVCP